MKLTIWKGNSNSGRQARDVLMLTDARGAEDFCLARKLQK